MLGALIDLMSESHAHRSLLPGADNNQAQPHSSLKWAFFHSRSLAHFSLEWRKWARPTYLSEVSKDVYNIDLLFRLRTLIYLTTWELIHLFNLPANNISILRIDITHCSCPLNVQKNWAKTLTLSAQQKKSELACSLTDFRPINGSVCSLSVLLPITRLG